jgi:hypothetical protein
MKIIAVPEISFDQNVPDVPDVPGVPGVPGVAIFVRELRAELQWSFL